MDNDNDQELDKDYEYWNDELETTADGQCNFIHLGLFTCTVDSLDHEDSSQFYS